MAQNLYVILGVAPDAEPEQITRAFRRLIRTLHPDAAPDTQPAARERFEQVVAAYRVLHDRAARAAHDRALATAPPTPDPPLGAGPHVPHRRGHPPLVAGPTVVHARPAAAPQAALWIGPPTPLSD